VNPVVISKIRFTNYTRITSHVKVVVQPGVQLLNVQRHIAGPFRFKPIRLLVANIPVIITPQLVVAIGVEGSVSATVTADLSQNTLFDYAVGWDNGALKTLRQKHDLSFPVIDWSHMQGANLKVYAGPQLDLLFWGGVGVYGTANGYWQLNATTQGADPLTHCIGLEAIVGVTAQVIGAIHVSVAVFEFSPQSTRRCQPLVQKPAATAIVLAERLNLRAGPGTSYGVVGTLSHGIKLHILEQPVNSGWMKVQTLSGTQTGWVNNRYVSLGTPDPPPPDWVLIPGGAFLMGSSQGDLDRALAECNATEGNCQLGWFDQELPERPSTLGDFQITRYEITNQQYNACVADGRCERAGRAISDNNITYSPVFFIDNYPVVGVNYHDANRFCNWIGARLPSEEEWEKAARGVDGRRYPWGDSLESGRANLGSGVPSAVGAYPSGASPYGVLDMAGNVFEWTSTVVNGRYMLRGGSWFKFPYRGRTTDRGTKLEPSFANYDIGFRCVR
jgi:formylglycine-generating enzyme required for sulfatase activity